MDSWVHTALIYVVGNPVYELAACFFVITLIFIFTFIFESDPDSVGVNFLRLTPYMRVKSDIIEFDL